RGERVLTVGNFVPCADEGGDVLQVEGLHRDGSELSAERKIRKAMRSRRQHAETTLRSPLRVEIKSFDGFDQAPAYRLIGNLVEPVEKDEAASGNDRIVD